MAPGGDAVLWVPSDPLKAELAKLLVHEEGFTRDKNKGGCSHQAMIKTIEKLRA